MTVIHVDAPLVVENLPASQLVQVETPEVLENLPGSQSVHVAADAEEAPHGPNVPTGHEEPEHVDDPVADENLPASQLVHVETEALANWPGLQSGLQVEIIFVEPSLH